MAGVAAWAEGSDITRVLVAYREGEKGAFDRLMGMVYDDLRRIAHHQLRRHRPGQTLSTTGLVHEAYLKMVDQSRVSWQDRVHFFRISSRAMRQILVDYARRRAAEKRGGGQVETTLDEGWAAVAEQAGTVLELNAALERLAEVDERLVQVVECRFFAGLTEEETAEALGVSARTVQRDWRRARAWLQEELRPS